MGSNVNPILFGPRIGSKLKTSVAHIGWSIFLHWDQQCLTWTPVSHEGHFKSHTLNFNFSVNFLGSKLYFQPLIFFQFLKCFDLKSKCKSTRLCFMRRLVNSNRGLVITDYKCFRLVWLSYWIAKNIFYFSGLLSYLIIWILHLCWGYKFLTASSKHVSSWAPGSVLGPTYVHITFMQRCACIPWAMGI